MKQYKYNIGDLVRVIGESEVGYDEADNRDIYTIKFNEPIIGKICGMKRKFLGKYNPQTPSYKYAYDIDVTEQAFLDVKGSVLLYEVKQGMLNKPILVLEEDIERLSSAELILKFRYQFPLIYSHKVVYSEEERKIMSEYSKSFPRDEKGRFCK